MLVTGVAVQFNFVNTNFVQTQQELTLTGNLEVIVLTSLVNIVDVVSAVSPETGTVGVIAGGNLKVGVTGVGVGGRRNSLLSLKIINRSTSKSGKDNSWLISSTQGVNGEQSVQCVNYVVDTTTGITTVDSYLVVADIAEVNLCSCVVNYVNEASRAASRVSSGPKSRIVEVVAGTSVNRLFR